MANLLIYEINHNVLTPNIESEFKKTAKYYSRFERHSIAFMLDNQPDILGKITFDLNEIIIDKQFLNEVAKNRLFSNLIDDFPELIITMLDCVDKSFLIKVRKRNVKKPKRY